ncbi:MAG: hypothetical protein SF069_16610 [Phycisphaerae bacterium]|nr:hypothetical protein [Phycisphaerae bacterium]
MGHLRRINKFPVTRMLAFNAVALTGGATALGAITIGAGPIIGTDTAGNTYRQEFQDWSHADCKALDGAGSSVGGRYNFNDGFDNSRDLIAFYSREEGGNYYFRADFYDLALGAENGNIDLYVAIDCAPGGQTWMPDFTDVRVDPAHNWELCIALYDSANRNVFRSDFSTTGGFVGSYYNKEIDAVEFGISRQTLIDAGWDGSRTLYFTVATVKDGSNGGAGEIGGAASDVTDTFFDDDRGFSDGFINGAIASNSTTGRAKFASVAHGNQSINQADDLRVHIFDPPTVNKTGFIRTLDTHQIFNVPINLHLSGSLIVAAKWAVAAPGDDPRTDGPAFLARVAEFVDLDQNDGMPGALVGGVFAEHIMPYFEGPANALSIQQFNELMLETFNLTPEDVPVMHTPERVIRSQSTGLSPLDGHTFEDIANSPYRATYLDEVTHLHWWYYPSEPWSGAFGGYEQPHHHKIHKINGVYCFMINDREDQQKFGPADGGLALDARFALVQKASHPDTAQLTLIFDDWEALAGKSFDPVQGISLENNNQWQYQQTIRWIANHPWIEVCNLNDLYRRATDPQHPQYNPAWVIDHGFGFSLSIQCYEWLKHASQDSYNNWYYDNNAGFPGNEQNFYNLVPVILGEQGDYHRRFGFPVTNNAQADSLDGPKLPSGKRHGDLNTVGSLMHNAWARIAAAPIGNLRESAELAFTSLIYETAWHEEDYGATNHYQGTSFGNPWPVPDPTWDGLNTWALRLHNHIRSVGMITAAADWAADVRDGFVAPQTVVESIDLDDDGQSEYVLRNNRIYAVFERWGGRLVHGFAYYDAIDDAVQVIGAPMVNPSEPGEEERAGQQANRCSAFKEMNLAYVDADFAVALGTDFVQFTSPDGKIIKRISLAPGAGELDAQYTNTTGSNHFVRIGASPNVANLVFRGRADLQVVSAADSYEVRNLQGGYVRVEHAVNARNNSPADAGYQNRNLALTEQIEVFGGPSFNFKLELTSSQPAFLPGDMNCDGFVTVGDIAGFVLALTNPTAYAAQYPTCDLNNADVNGDGFVTVGDIAGFVALLTGG